MTRGQPSLKTIASVIALSLGLLAAPLAADAQQPEKVYRIGFLGLSSATAASPVADAFRKGLQEHGYVEGRNLVIEYRCAEGKMEHLPELVADLVNRRVDVIFAGTPPTALAAKGVTTTVPVVFAGISNPVEIGLVMSLARPGGNVTGVSTEVTLQQAAKQLELLKEVAPTVTRVAVPGDPGFRSSLVAYQEDVQAAAQRHGLEFIRVDVSGAEDLDGAFAAIVQARAGAVWVLGGAVQFAQRRRIAEFATARRLATIAPFREFVDAGGLISYGASLPENFRRAAAYVDISKCVGRVKSSRVPV